jgi:integrase
VRRAGAARAGDRQQVVEIASELEGPWLDGIVRAKRPERLPVVLTRPEVLAVLRQLEGVPRLMVSLLYEAGLRLLECCRLRVQDIDFATNQIVVRGAKGDKDRMTMLPAAIKGELARTRSATLSRRTSSRTAAISVPSRKWSAIGT